MLLRLAAQDANTLRRERLLLAGQDDNYVAPRRLVRLATLLEKVTAFGLQSLGFGPPASWHENKNLA